MLRLPRKKGPEMLQVLRLPRKTKRRPKASLVARLPPTSMKVLQVLRLPPETNLRCSECCACHTKRARDAPSAAPATQNEAAPKSLTRRQTSADLYEGAPSAAPATQNEPEVLRVLRRKTSQRCSKCCAWPATQNGAALKSLTRCQTSADLYEGALLRLPRKKGPEMLQVLRLPRKTRRRPKASLIARLPPTSLKVLQVLRLPRGADGDVLRMLC